MEEQMKHAIQDLKMEKFIKQSIPNECKEEIERELDDNHFLSYRANKNSLVFAYCGNAGGLLAKIKEER